MTNFEKEEILKVIEKVKNQMEYGKEDLGNLVEYQGNLFIVVSEKVNQVYPSLKDVVLKGYNKQEFFTYVNELDNDLVYLSLNKTHKKPYVVIEPYKYFLKDLDLDVKEQIFTYTFEKTIKGEL